MTLRGMAVLALFMAAMAAAPLVANDYLISVLVLILIAAYIGQTWNIMMGFAGLLSLGHALYIGLGAYVSAARSSCITASRPGSACRSASPSPPPPAR
jgi:branched-chain amino acid transport system permease protein